MTAGCLPTLLYNRMKTAQKDTEKKAERNETEGRLGHLVLYASDASAKKYRTLYYTIYDIVSIFGYISWHPTTKTCSLF